MRGWRSLRRWGRTADFAAFQKMLAHYSGYEGVLAVGHNPNVFQFLGRLITGNGGAAVRMRKGSVARIDLDKPSAAAAMAHRSAFGAGHLRQRAEESRAQRPPRNSPPLCAATTSPTPRPSPGMQFQINSLGIDLDRDPQTSLARSWLSATARRSSTTAFFTRWCSTAGMLRSARSPGCGRLLPR